MRLAPLNLATQRVRKMATHAALSAPQQLAQRCRELSSSPETRAAFLPFSVAQQTLGYVSPVFAGKLARWPDVFHVSETAVVLGGSEASVEQRSAAVADCMRQLQAEGVITGWRNELLPVAAGFGLAPELLLERAAAPFFGIRAYGVHVNCFVRSPHGVLVWVARRSMSKSLWPGLLDHAVAGALPHGVSPQDNVVKEAGEEAGIPPELAARAVPAGVVSYCAVGLDWMKRDVLFAFDLELPPEFMPTPTDGEVDQFSLLPVDRVVELAASGSYKPNCVLIIADWLIRNGFLTPEQPGYLELCDALRTGDLR